MHMLLRKGRDPLVTGAMPLRPEPPLRVPWSWNGLIAGVRGDASRLPADRVERVPARAQGGWLRRSQVAMGTPVSVLVWADDRPQGEAAIAAVIAEFQRIDRTVSPDRVDSELSRVNAQAGSRPVKLGDELAALVQRAVACAALSFGAGDVAVEGSWQDLEFDPVAGTLGFSRSGVRIDLAWLALGHALDAARAALARRGIRHALMCAGGDCRVIGDRRGAPWSYRIRDPRRSDALVAVLPAQGAAVSTLGDCDCGVGPVHEGLRRTVAERLVGQSPAGMRSVTVLAADGVTAATLSRAAFARGADEGLRMVAAVPGAQALAIDAGGEVHQTRGPLRWIDSPDRAAALIEGQ